MERKGISLIVLLVTIVIIIILASTVTISGYNVYNNANKTEFASEVAYVEDIVGSYISNNNGKYPSTVKIYIDTTKIESADLSTQFEGEQLDGTVLELNKIDFSLLNPFTLTYGMSTESESDDVYAISGTTGRIYYVRGIIIGGNTYYTLNDELKRKIGLSKNNINDGILFLNKGMDNGKCKIDIKIPENYSDISVLSTNGSFSYTTENDSGYIFYKTNSGASGVITVKYKTSSDGNLKEIKYNVDNVDSEAPSFHLSGVQTVLDAKTGETQKYVSILNLSDNLSGVKWVKYATSSVNENDAKEYFQNKGILVRDNIISINEGKYYTVYVEDYAGNYSVNYYDSNSENYKYVTDGLILHLDGMQNNRINNANVWNDLSTYENDAILYNFDNNLNSGWQNNSLLFDGQNDYLKLSRDLDLNNTKQVTIQFVDLDGTLYSNNSVGLFMELSQNYNSVNNSFVISFDEWLSKSFACGVHFNRWNAKYDSLGIQNTSFSYTIIINTEEEYDKFISMYYGNQKRNLSNVDNLNIKNLTLNSYPLYIGSRAGSSLFMKMKLANLRIYNRALTEEEINQNYETDKYRFNVQ